jgi:hypothetical protein
MAPAPTKLTKQTAAAMVYAAKTEAGRRGHALAGKPTCLCGQEFNSPADLDYHLMAAAAPAGLCYLDGKHYPGCGHDDTSRQPQGGGDWVTDNQGRLDDGHGDPL